VARQCEPRADETADGAGAEDHDCGHAAGWSCGDDAVRRGISMLAIIALLLKYARRLRRVVAAGAAARRGADVARSLLYSGRLGGCRLTAGRQLLQCQSVVGCGRRRPQPAASARRHPPGKEKPLATGSTTSLPALPKRIRRLGELAYNLWWSWHPEAVDLYESIDPVMWNAVRHNPVRQLQEVPRKRLNAVMQRKGYVEQYDRVLARFDAYMQAGDTWFTSHYPELAGRSIAYFSMEFGLHEALPVYAGGLGVLSGDHAKEASDLGLPFVCMGFLYQLGYFRQKITEDGWQESIYDRLDLDTVPVLPVRAADGSDLVVTVELPGRTVAARVWAVQVGRVTLYLLDSDLDRNDQADRALTSRLYWSDLELRISQEVVLGIGGVRALRALGIDPAVWHLNEGHSAFLGLERLREKVGAGTPFAAALEQVRATTVFTTHTPVPAGNDAFPLWMMEKYFWNTWEDLGLTREEFMNLALHDQAWGPTFSMTVLGLRVAAFRNGVSELHGEVARRMWHFLYPEREVDEVPISAVTNGIHTGTWLAPSLHRLYDRHLGRDWEERRDELGVWDRVRAIPDEELWAVRRHLKRKLANFIRDRARERWEAGQVVPVQVVAAGVLLDPYALTIGFARRFATYKRATLVLRDLARLLGLLRSAERPLQIIFAGKAHPNDDPGKKFIQDIYRLVKSHESAGRLVFIENYDINIARYLVQGVDVWLNTPRRPHEASGTSGQKAAINGVLNLSVLDGWWREAYNGENGWAIGDERDYDDPEEQDEADAESLYELLENEILPLYYEHEGNGIPHGWTRRMKESIATLAPIFSTRRMVKEYTTEMYVPALQAREAPPAAEPAPAEPAATKPAASSATPAAAAAKPEPLRGDGASG
jgi:starch phosphorylase